MGDKLANSNLSSEALYLAADPGRVEETEKLVPVEVKYFSPDGRKHNILTELTNLKYYFVGLGG